MEQKKKKKKSSVEEGFNADNREDEEETTYDVSIHMDTYGPGIDPHTEVIPSDIVLTYASDDDTKSKSDINYEPKENDDDVLGAKEYPVGTSIYYSLPKANICFATRLRQTTYDSIVDQISICGAVQNR